MQTDKPMTELQYPYQHSNKARWSFDLRKSNKEKQKDRDPFLIEPFSSSLKYDRFQLAVVK